MPAPNSFLCAFLILAAGLLMPPVARAQQAEVFFNDRPPAGLMTQPDHLIVADQYTIILRTPRLREYGTDTYLVAVPPGDLSYEFQEVVLRNQQSGEELDVSDDEKYMGNRITRTGVFGRTELKELGNMRGVRLAVLRINRENPIYVNRVPHEIASYKIAIKYPKVPAKSDRQDTAFVEGSYRTLLEKSVSNSMVLDRFALPLSANPFPGPASWQPRPELSAGFPWLKIPVRETSLYAIDGRWMSDAGLDPKTVKPEDLYLMTGGLPVAMDVVGPEGAGFNGGQRVLFYGVGNDSEETAEKMYFLGSRPRGMAPVRFAPGPAYDAEGPELPDYQRKYFSQEDNFFQTRVGHFLSIRSMAWVWEIIEHGVPSKVSFEAPGYINGDVAATGKLIMYYSFHRPPFNSKIDISINGKNIVSKGVLPRDGSHYEFELPAGLLQQNLNDLEITLFSGEQNRPNAASQVIAIDGIELTYTSQFNAQDGIHEVDLEWNPASPTGLHRLRGSGFRTPRLSAIDVTDVNRPLRLATEPYRGLSFIQADLKPDSHILLVESDLVPRAPLPRKSRWQNWDSTDKSADLLVIYHNAFEEAGEQLAADIRETGREVVTAEVEGLYEAWNDGNLSWEPIRDFISRAVHDWKGNRPAAVILIGDTTGDGRGIARNDIVNYLPTITAAASRGRDRDTFSMDQAFANVVGDDELVDILVGRISVTSPEEALAAVANMRDYRNLRDEKQDWTDDLLTIADSEEFTRVAQELHEEVISPRVDHHFLLADDAVWEDNYYLPPEVITREDDSKVSSDMTTAIERQINEGQAVVTFIGHGAPNLWSNQRYWFGGGTPNSDILRLENAGRFPYVVTFTCNNAVIDYPLKPWNICIAEDFMRHRNKGAIAVFMPSAPGYISQHKHIAEGFFKAWSKLGVSEHGVIAEMARLNYQARVGTDNHSRMFTFLGDPTLEIPPAADTSLKDYGRDAELDRTGGDLLMADIVDSPENTASGLTRSWNVVLANESSRQKILPLSAKLIGKDGEVVDYDERFISLRALENKMEEMSLTAPGPGVYVVSFEIPHESGEFYREYFPTRSYGEPVFFGRKHGPLDIVEGSVRMRPDSSPRGGPRVEVAIANPNPSVQSGSLVATFTRDGEVLRTEGRQMTNLAAGSVTRIAFPLRGIDVVESDFTVEFVLNQKNEAGDMSEQDRLEYRVEPLNLPDLYVDEATISVSPEELSAGKTVFVEGWVGNRGGAMSAEFPLRLYRATDVESKEPLRNMSRQAPITAGPLKPGERQRFRLRWDPANNAGAYQIKVVADPEKMMLEPNRRNNEAIVPLSVLNKWRLFAGELLVRPSENRTLVLAAEIANRGDISARNVLVTFYKTKDQHKDGKIGEVVVPIVGPHEIVPAVLEWQLQEKDMNLNPAELSFTIALKGSLQRISSAEDR